MTAPETVELRARVSGYVASIAYTEGAEVAVGDVLFTIDDRRIAPTSIAPLRSSRARARPRSRRPRPRVRAS